MNKSVCLSTAYLAPISYYCKLLIYDHVLIEQWEHYVKQTYRNRCIISTNSGCQSLCVPVERHILSNTSIKDIHISDHGNWRHLHWQALVTAYKGSPYFEYYADEFHPFYEKKFNFLFDFNEELRENICDLLDIHPQVEYTASYMDIPNAEDCRMLISPKGCQEDTMFSPKPYFQVFAERLGFIPNLSIIDLLFNMGPEGIFTLMNSIKKFRVPNDKPM